MSDGFYVGQKVCKPKGYPFPGEVRALFTNRHGEARLVVESTVLPGMLHIFSPTQVERIRHLQMGLGAVACEIAGTNLHSVGDEITVSPVLGEVNCPECLDFYEKRFNGRPPSANRK